MLFLTPLVRLRDENPLFSMDKSCSRPSHSSERASYLSRSSNADRRTEASFPHLTPDASKNQEEVA